MAFRHTAAFVSDWRPHSRVLDRNERAKIMALADALERRTKPAGKRNGVLGYVGLTVLRALMVGFLNHRTGLCCPSYRALQDKTGLCRQSIANGLARLEMTGIVKIVRRLVRERVNRISPITGEPESYVGTVQTTSLYALHRPGAWSDHLERPAGRRTPFPAKRQLDLLQAMALSWSVKLSLSDRQKRPTPGNQIARLLSPEGKAR
jgi:hypothetical protein